MIILHAEAAGERLLMDREALAASVFVSEATVRRHCVPVKKDPVTGRLFYDAEACGEILEKVHPRRKMCEDGIRRRFRD